MQFFNQLIGENVRLNVVLRNAAFYPGNVIEGVLEVVVSIPVPFTAIRIRACGKEYVNVVRIVKEPIETPQGEPQRYRDKTVTHSNKQALFNQLITVAGSMKTRPIPFGSLLIPGTYYYPFAFQLPKQLAPSFSKKIGDDFAEMVYYIKAYMDIPVGRDCVTRTPFRVIRPMPISQHQMAAPFKHQQTFDITCCCCVSKGKVSINMFMNRTIIALDRDTLEVCCDVDNTLGEEPVNSMTIALTNFVSYTAGGMTENHRLNAGTQTLKNQVIPAKSTGRFTGTVMLDRNALPSVRTFNVKSEYVITATLDIPWATDPVQNINVIVGQSVDESNWSEPIQFNQVQLNPLPRHTHSVPETYYAPPPQPVFNFNPLPFQMPSSYQPTTYQFNPAPLGVPPAQWQQTGTYVQGQQQQPQQSNLVWQQGYGF